MKFKKAIFLFCLFFCLIIINNNVKAINSIKYNNLNTQKINSYGIGSPIKDIFIDTNFAQLIADEVASGDTNAILTQTMADNITMIDGYSKNIADLSGIEVLTSLQLLYVGSNKIASLPNGFGNLSSLVIFDIQNNLLTSLPDEIGNLSNLEFLNVQQNSITKLPDTIGNLNSLTRFYAYSNNITYLPSSIGNLTLLIELLLDRNNISTLPDSITNLKNIEVLNISYNLLETLPTNIGNMNSLKQVYFYNNKLAYLPESIGNLTSLKDLSLMNNQLTSLPNSIANLNSLSNIFLYNNLLPSNYASTLNSLGLNIIINNEVQGQLKMRDNVNPISVTDNFDFNNLELLSFVEINSAGTLSNVSLMHNALITSYVDKDGNTVSLDSFYKNGKVIKDGSLFAQIRLSGTGLFPNNSDRALTIDKLEFKFNVSSFIVKFDLNNAPGTPPNQQTVKAGNLITKPSNPSRSNYTFMGWTLSDGTLWNFSSSTMPTRNITLYAKWSKNSTIDGNDKNKHQIPIPKTGNSINLFFISIFIISGLSTIFLLNQYKKS